MISNYDEKALWNSFASDRINSAWLFTSFKAKKLFTQAYLQMACEQFLYVAKQYGFSNDKRVYQQAAPSSINKLHISVANDT